MNIKYLTRITPPSEEHDHKRKISATAAFDKKLKIIRNGAVLSDTSHMIHVRRSHLFTDSYSKLTDPYGSNSPSCPLLSQYSYVRFTDEQGTGDGLTREWHWLFSKELGDPKNGLFVPTASGAFHPKIVPDHQITPKLLDKYRFAGLFLAKAISTHREVDFGPTRAILKVILGQELTFEDLKFQDPQKYQSLKSILEYQGSVESLGLFMEVSYEQGGVFIDQSLRGVGLRPTKVTNYNRHRYVHLSAQFVLYKAFEKQMGAFVSGFHAVLPQPVLHDLSVEELGALLSADPQLDIDDWMTNSSYPVATHFWSVLKALPKDTRELPPLSKRDYITPGDILFFATGVRRPPVGGFKNMVPHFNMAFFRNDWRLPMGFTCGNSLEIPACKSQDELLRLLTMAVKESSGYEMQ